MCEFWRDGDSDFSICDRIDTNKDVRVTARRMLTNGSFGCIYFKGKED